jgi:hypothetical protein
MIKGLREGAFISAILVGLMTKFYGSIFRVLKQRSAESNP